MEVVDNHEDILLKEGEEEDSDHMGLEDNDHMDHLLDEGKDLLESNKDLLN